MMKLELHIHTKKSKDSFLGKYMLYLMCKLRKVKCIAITDHDEIEGAMQFQRWFQKRGIQIIVGEEIFTKDGEIIGLFLQHKIMPGMSVVDTVKEIREQKGLVYIPHPYDEKRIKTVIRQDKLQMIKDEVDIIETYNGRNISPWYAFKQNEIANALPNAIKVIGSDAHCFFELGRNIMFCEEDMASLDAALLLQILCRSSRQEKQYIKFAHSWTRYVRALKMLLKGEWNELCKSVYRRCQKRNANIG